MTPQEVKRLLEKRLEIMEAPSNEEIELSYQVGGSHRLGGRDPKPREFLVDFRLKSFSSPLGPSTVYAVQVLNLDRVLFDSWSDQRLIVAHVRGMNGVPAISDLFLSGTYNKSGFGGKGVLQEWPGAEFRRIYAQAQFAFMPIDALVMANRETLSGKPRLFDIRRIWCQCGWHDCAVASRSCWVPEVVVRQYQGCRVYSPVCPHIPKSTLVLAAGDWYVLLSPPPPYRRLLQELYRVSENIVVLHVQERNSGKIKGFLASLTEAEWPADTIPELVEALEEVARIYEAAVCPPLVEAVKVAITSLQERYPAIVPQPFGTEEK